MIPSRQGMPMHSQANQIGMQHPNIQMQQRPAPMPGMIQSNAPPTNNSHKIGMQYPNMQMQQGPALMPGMVPINAPPTNNGPNETTKSNSKSRCKNRQIVNNRVPQKNEGLKPNEVSGPNPSNTMTSSVPAANGINQVQGVLPRQGMQMHQTNQMPMQPTPIQMPMQQANQMPMNPQYQQMPMHPYQMPMNPHFMGGNMNNEIFKPDEISTVNWEIGTSKKFECKLETFQLFVKSSQKSFQHAIYWKEDQKILMEVRKTKINHKFTLAFNGNEIRLDDNTHHFLKGQVRILNSPQFSNNFESSLSPEVNVEFNVSMHQLDQNTTLLVQMTYEQVKMIQDPSPNVPTVSIELKKKISDEDIFEYIFQKYQTSNPTIEKSLIYLINQNDAKIQELIRKRIQNRKNVEKNQVITSQISTNDLPISSKSSKISDPNSKKIYYNLGIKADSQDLHSSYEESDIIEEDSEIEESEVSEKSESEESEISEKSEIDEKESDINDRSKIADEEENETILDDKDMSYFNDVASSVQSSSDDDSDLLTELLESRDHCKNRIETDDHSIIESSYITTRPVQLSYSNSLIEPLHHSSDPSIPPKSKANLQKKSRSSKNAIIFGVELDNYSSFNDIHLYTTQNPSNHRYIVPDSLNESDYLDDEEDSMEKFDNELWSKLGKVKQFRCTKSTQTAIQEKNEVKKVRKSRGAPLSAWDNGAGSNMNLHKRFGNHQKGF